MDQYPHWHRCLPRHTHRTRRGKRFWWAWRLRWELAFRWRLQKGFRTMDRGLVTGAMTTAGGLGHTLPFLLHNFRTAMSVAIIVVAVELAAISFVRHKYMDTPFLQAAFQVVVGGVLVFLTGILIGSS